MVDEIYNRPPRKFPVIAGGKEKPEQERDLPHLPIEGEPWREDELEKRMWLAPGYLMEGSVTIMAGAPAAGKSLIACGYACALSLGTAWGRFRPAGQMRVSIVNVEDDDIEQKKRLSAVLRQFPSKGPADLNGWLVRIQPDKSPLLVKWVVDEEGAYEIVPTLLMLALIEHIKIWQPKVLFIDPMAEIHNGEENRNEIVKALVAYFRVLAKTYRLAVVLVHHVRKGSEEHAGKADAVRGGGAISAAARVVLTCMPMTEKDADQVGVDPKARFSFTRVDGAKLNYGPMGTTDWYVKEVIPLDNGEDTPAAVPWRAPPALAVSPEVLADLCAALARGVDHQPYSPRMSSDARSIRSLFRSRGVERSQESKVLTQLMGLGVERHQFKSPGNRHDVWGFRTRDLFPRSKWIDGVGHPDAPIDASMSFESASEHDQTASMAEEEELRWPGD